MPSTRDTTFDLPQIGEVRWLGVRPMPVENSLGVREKQPMQVIEAVEARVQQGLVGDRYNGKSGKREVTLIQWEHLAVIAALLGRNTLTPELLRRNIAVEKINLLALVGSHFSIGGAVLAATGIADPCAAMETALGRGGFHAMNGHGGITARVICAGIIRVGDTIARL
jgi:MOSC domain-containing protein YiiM